MRSINLFIISSCFVFAQLISPAYNDSLNTIHVYFEWEQQSTAVSYQLQVSENDSLGFQDPTVDLIDSTLLTILEEGLHWNTSYNWRIRSINPMGDFGEWSEIGIFHTKTLPEEIMSLDVSIYDSLSVADGITVMDQLGEGIIYAIDIHGNPVWFAHSDIVWSNGFSYLMQFSHFLQNGNFIGIAEGREINLPGRTFEMGINNDLIWEGPGNLELFGVHHDVFPMPNGNVLALTIQDTLLPIPEDVEVPENYAFVDSLPWFGDRIVEWNNDGNEVWSWSVFDHFDLVDWNQESYELLFVHLSPAEFFFEWTHSNAIWFDEVENVVYLSVRNMSRIAKIDYPSGEIIWNMGKEMPSGDVTVGTDLGFSGQHSIKVLENGNLMMYDNGIENDSLVSRGLEISVSETDSIPHAEMVWEYILPSGLGSGLMSDCDRLSNGNSLLTSTVGNYIVEVSPENEIIWEVLPDQEGSTYRSERIPRLYRQAFAIIQPDFTEGPDGPILELAPGDVTLVYRIINKGWQNENYFYTLSDDLGWFSDSGSVEINSGEEAELFISGNIPNEGVTNTIMFTVFPENAIQLVKVVSLNLEVLNPDAEITMSIPHTGDWNMVGLPVIVSNPQYQSVFPSSIPNSCFGFTEEYTQVEELELGNGYWLRFSDAGTTDITGFSMNELEVEISADWNIISGITDLVDVYEGIYDPAGILIPGTFYEFDGNYQNSIVLEAGKGYWVRALENGEIIISFSPPLTTKVVVVESENANNLTFGNQTLYFGTDIPDEEVLSYSLPPKPPVGGKDIRFSGDTKLCAMDECVIEVMNDGRPLTFEFDIKDGENWEIIPVIANQVQLDKAIYLTGDKQFALSSEFKQLILRKSTSTQTPTEFALFPAHPNPFNPVTTIQFSVGVEMFGSNVSRPTAGTSLQVYDITGKLVEILVDEKLSPGNHTVQWDAGKFPSGVYFLKMEAGSFSQVEKLMLIK